MNKDFKNADEFLSPGCKANESLESFTLRMLQSKARWTAVKIKSKKCNTKSLCIVVASVTYEYKFR